MGINIRIGSLAVGDDHPVRMMGVLNLSPESFYAGSVASGEELVRRAGNMLAAGAELLDIGGRSTAPKSRSISVEEEIDRVSAALELLFTSVELGDTLLSIDTQFRAVAERSFQIFRRHGREDQFLLNDVSNLRVDPGLADWISEVGKPLILMAAHRRPGDSLGIDETIRDLTRSLESLEERGYGTQERVIVDPAIGRWIAEKVPEYDLELISNLERFRCLKRPLLVGISRKSFIGSVLGRSDPAERFYGSLSATAIAVYHGAHLVRTHDANRETREVIEMASALRKSRL